MTVFVPERILLGRLVGGVSFLATLASAFALSLFFFSITVSGLYFPNNAKRDLARRKSNMLTTKTQNMYWYFTCLFINSLSKLIDWWRDFQSFL